MTTASFFTLGFPLPETEEEHGYLPSIPADLDRGFRIDYTFPGVAGDVDIVYEVYNIQTGWEPDFKIVINNETVGIQGAACENVWSSKRIFTLPDSEVNDTGTNIVSFNYKLNTPDTFTEEWGMRQVGINVLPPNPVWAIPYNTVNDIHWTPQPNVVGYNVYSSTVSGGPYTKLNTALLTRTLNRDLGLTNGTTYYYVVRSEDATGFEGVNSNEVNATPSTSAGVTPITDLQVLKLGNDARLQWTHPTTSEGVQFYRVYRVYPPDFTRGTGNVLDEPASPYDHIDALIDGQTYYYDVAVVDNLDQEDPE
jgi:hypothetical protein